MYWVFSYSATFPDSPWHAGTTVTIVWTAQDLGVVPSDGPVQLTLDASLSSRFDTVAGLKTSAGSGVPTVRAPTITTDSWSGTPTFTVEWRLPADLAPGFYDLAQRVSEPGGFSAGGAVVTVTS